jgi:DUF4097 and DUF4098 domain-containing protein YvlB
MKTLVKKTWISGSLLTALLVFSNDAHAQVSKRSVAVDGVSNVKIETAGTTEEIDVKGWDNKQVQVECKDGELKIETKAGTILIQNDLTNGCETIAVKMPKDLKLKVGAVSGNVTVASLDNRVDITSVSGDVKLSGINGTIDIEAVSGDVDIRSVRGDLSCKAVSGEVKITDMIAARLEAKSVSGDIEVDNSKVDDIRMSTHSGDVEYNGVSTPKNEIKVKSFSGDLKITLPASSGFEISAKTQSGSIDIEHKIQASERSEKKVSGIFLKGGSDITLSTFSGDIKLRISSK